jgi:CheY-like chemotaxis protein
MTSGSMQHVRGRVLVVDDEPTIGDVVSRYLRRAGYDTEVAATGQDALSRAVATVRTWSFWI